MCGRWNLRPHGHESTEVGAVARRCRDSSADGSSRTMEPPVKPAFKGKAPKLIRPRPSPPLADALRRFLESQNLPRRFLRTYADIDLAGVRFPNPFVRGVRFSLATGLHVIVAHERRHLWQARRVREALAASNSRLRTP